MIESFKLPVITKETVSGSVASFNSEYAELPLDELIVAITATQEGSGTPSPSNVRPIHGWTQANIVNSPESKWNQLWSIDSNFRGIVVFNQILRNPNFVDTRYWIGEKATAVVSNNIMTVTTSEASNNIYIEVTSVPKVAGHKYLYIIDAKEDIAPTGGHWYIRLFYNGTSATVTNTINSENWVTYSGILANETTTSGYSPFRIGCGDNDGEAQVSVRNAGVYDLTQMFGSTIADYIYSLEQATAGAGVAFFRNLYTEDYYDYNTGTTELVGGDDKVVTTVPFGQTVYGGTLDVLSGLLTVTHGNIASYNGETINEPWISSIDEYIEGTTPSTGAQVVYPLTTPIEIQLTPTQIETLVGENNIFADTGDTSVKYLKVR